ncbi:WD40 repeat [Lecanosticta acicola]|uniref:WD40 repeat n=1 Tax=Lecanosticta acicola TaxID=111012 RepID=A0AAI8YYZ1_9PEZI|nr:WD40 repeat [Lecanosticta acicola]
MSSFFTLPASQKKRKRTQGDGVSRPPQRKELKTRTERDGSISGSEDSDDDREARTGEEYEGSDSEDEEFANEDSAAKRIRLAEQYLANTQKEVLDDVGFDAAEVDQENLRHRMGERLKEDTAETKGKLYRWIAQDFDWSKAERAQFRHHQQSVTSVAIAGEHAYTVGKDAILVKWRLPGERPPMRGWQNRTRKPAKLLVSRKFGKNTNSNNSDQHTKAILCVAASQDGKFVATGGADKKLIVWDAATLKPLKVFYQHRDTVESLAFRRGTNQLFTASKDRTVKIWSLDELAYVETLFGHQDEVADVSALAQETCVTVGARDRTARYWKVVEESQLVFRGGGAPSKSKLSRYGNDSGIELPEDPHHEGSTDRVACVDDETFITGSDNGSISLWNIHKKKAVYTYPLAHGMDPPLPLEQVSAEEEPPEDARTKPQPRWITALRAIPFSDAFVTGSWDGYVRVWKISADKRRIEPLGCLGRIDQSVDQLLEQEGLSSHAMANGALEAMREGTEKQGVVTGIINDLAIVDKGDRGKEGVVVVAAVGKEPRLARWKEIYEATNCAVLFEIPRKTLDASTTSDTVNGEEGHTNDDEFAGFD